MRLDFADKAHLSANEFTDIEVLGWSCRQGTAKILGSPAGIIDYPVVSRAVSGKPLEFSYDGKLAELLQFREHLRPAPFDSYPGLSQASVLKLDDLYDLLRQLEALYLSHRELSIADGFAGAGVLGDFPEGLPEGRVILEFNRLASLEVEFLA